MKKIQSKMRALDWSQHYRTLSFSDAQGHITPASVVGSGLNLTLFKHILITCKNEDDSVKNESVRVVTTVFP